MHKAIYLVFTRLNTTWRHDGR